MYKKRDKNSILYILFQNQTCINLKEKEFFTLFTQGNFIILLAILPL